ncbi:metal-dependent hydrolase (plasmid) [Paenibacillus thiaminolyticus]|uniref:metal-dependent hydrolase n=1 Tax=Paenibacillus thiaminolyticus TaxID=49283 RepID=UPI00232F9AB3|nr:metal-dependent hydrolase [Paenibacillus thiaminolyticus]WCF11762.1 metal-dependent hydrolase [Paenibacillus thiaminolyticus]
MKYPAHIIGGITFGIVSHHMVIKHLPIMQYNSTPLLVFSFIAGSLFGSLLPDIDHRGSYLGRRLPFISWIANATMGHRGATHAPLVTIMITLILLFLSSKLLSGTYELCALLIVLGMAVGAISHLFLDSLTKSGIPLFYPFTSKHYRLARMKTGGIGETLTTLGMIIFVIWFFSKHYITNV